ncbi:hypothetical protein E3Q19_02868 [Wallemia mellicola]|nr:hypothetical protein E3Q19_02868 [Wallemia mellicola]TIC23069.1 hypothetical protein E3Q11_04000 [Wallemia mellicola]TIC74938.1 hypothetical protein E3Q00_01371 [Wallemia mellicola]
MPVEQVVENFESVFGQVTDANLMYDKETGRSRGFGFLTFETEQQAEDAVKEGRFDLEGKSVEVKRVQTRNERSGTQEKGFQTSMFGGPTNNPFNPQAMAAMYQRMGWNAFGGMGMMNPMMMGGMGGMGGMMNPMMQMMQQQQPTGAEGGEDESAYGSYGGPLQPGLGQVMSSELPRTAYADALINARPGDSVSALQTRLKKAAILQEEMANFFQARASVEMQYAASLNKITRSKPFISDVQLLNRTGLGAVWDDLQDELFQVSVLHEKLAKKISEQIEKPLRMSSQSGEWGSLPQSDSDMNRLIKSVDENQKNVNKVSGLLSDCLWGLICYQAQRKVDSTGGKKADAANAKLSQAQQTYANAQQNFITMAPSYFTSYQIADSNRLQELKSVFVKWETIQSETNQSKQTLNENNLADILNWSTEGDLNDYLTQVSALLGITGVNGTPTGISQAAEPPRPAHNRSTSTLRDNATGVRSSIANTFFNRHRSKSNPSRESYIATPDNDNAPPVPAISDNFRPSSTMGDLSALNHPAAQSATQLDPVNEDLMDTREPEAQEAVEATEAPGPLPAIGIPASLQPGNQQAPPVQQMQQPQQLQQQLPSQMQPPQQSMEAQTFPATGSERGLSPVATGNEEEDEAAMSKVRQSLIAAAPIQRRPTALRGRRDVRQTMFVNDVPDDMPLSEALKQKSNNPFATTGTPSTQLNTKKSFDTVETPPNERTLSMTSQTPSLTPSIQQRNIVDPFEGTDHFVEGVKPAITESVNVLIKSGEILKVMITGEVSLLYKPSSILPSSPPVIRLNAFEELEKVAPNPQYLRQVEEKHGEYYIDLDNLQKAPNNKALVLKYQLYISTSKFKEYVPLISTMKWRYEPTTHSAIVNYNLNQESRLIKKNDILKDVQFTIPINAKNVQSKPQGVYSPERKKITWVLNDISLEQPSDKILARFIIDGETQSQQQQQPAQIKWTIDGALTSNVDIEFDNLENVYSTIKNSTNGKFLIS